MSLQSSSGERVFTIEEVVSMNILDRPEYRFLKTDPHLGQNIIFLTLMGEVMHTEPTWRAPTLISGAAP